MITAQDWIGYAISLSTEFPNKYIRVYKSERGTILVRVENPGEVCEYIDNVRMTLLKVLKNGELFV